MRLDARGLSLTRGGHRILDGVDVALRAGEFVAVVGPNGAGKSSLLRLLAGLARPDAGEIACDGVPLGKLPPRTRARSIAYLEQRAAVHWPMRVDEIVALGRLPSRGPLGAATSADAAAIAAAMEMTTTTALAGRRADTLSGGERMRVLLARALAVGAPLLLADEPVAALDPHHQLHVMATLRETARRGAGVMIVLHDLALATRFCDRVVLLAAGRCLADGPPAEVLDDRRLAEAYAVDVLRGSEGGEPWILPWRRLAPAGVVRTGRDDQSKPEETR
ncbi:ABC transporter ATP-binding protein [Methylobrevis albus]|uniref:ABC transporter ATP-binding protein n=1 Tax=Methylobrevis albus TaxID=2793297 RepID=A0A931I4Q3_9HYPH|nr:ABC transporter ATP-binding protein [Methylobrevis albus]MBH0239877.1 ABC transporter ATP-binding protein [Methylobrevis albus]